MWKPKSESAPSMCVASHGTWLALSRRPFPRLWMMTVRAGEALSSLAPRPATSLQLLHHIAARCLARSSPGYAAAAQQVPCMGRSCWACRLNRSTRARSKFLSLAPRRWRESRTCEQHAAEPGPLLCRGSDPGVSSLLEHLWPGLRWSQR